jgi:hypothetical protein
MLPTCVPQIERNFERMVCPIDHEASRLISLAATAASKPWRGSPHQHGHAVQPLAVHQIKRDNPPDASANTGLPQLNRDRTISPHCVSACRRRLFMLGQSNCDVRHI